MKGQARVSLGILFFLAFTNPLWAGEGSSQAARTQFVEAGDMRYAYRSFGAGSEIPLLMMIRYRANMDDWDPAFLDALAEQRRVVVFNQAGVSSSGGTTPSTISGMAADVARFAAAMEFDKIDVLGWSMAGFTAQAISVDFPDLVRRTIIVGSGPPASPRTPPPNEGVFDVATKPPRADGRTTYSDKDREYLFFADHPRSLALAQESLRRIDQARRQAEPLTNAAVQEAQTSAIQHWWFDPSHGYFEKLKTIQQPVFIINGDRDAFFTVGASNLLYTEIPRSQLAIFPQAGHGPQHQFPRLIARMIHEFLD